MHLATVIYKEWYVAYHVVVYAISYDKAKHGLAQVNIVFFQVK